MPLIRIKPVTSVSKIKPHSVTEKRRQSTKYETKTEPPGPKFGAKIGGQPIVNVLVLGLGCGWKKKITSLPELSRQLTEETGRKTYVMCNTSTPSVVRNIVKVSCGIRPSRTTPFVLAVEEKVKTLVDSGKRVKLIGHSFGGSVVSRVAENLYKTKYNDRIDFYTIGSIYLTGLPHVNHILHVKNIALKCSGMVPGQPTVGEAKIKWIGTKNNSLSSKQAHKVSSYWKTITTVLNK
ncbi:hypothetical protein PBCVCvsA1_641L [Paramecium bursaria Chlorella virus CvsA1]|nr:hypothetical protein PBCVCvsA1_641L [Paramecium bursaria Chlorella virus CvsA1]AGE55444.1 hypothetical protein PBCVMA1E_729L [Paramecium bursaria Chlorella virus MA1E]